MEIDEIPTANHVLPDIEAAEYAYTGCPGAPSRAVVDQIIALYLRNLEKRSIMAMKCQPEREAAQPDDSSFLDKPLSQMSQEEYQKVDEWIWANTPMREPAQPVELSDQKICDIVAIFSNPESPKVKCEDCNGTGHLDVEDEGGYLGRCDECEGYGYYHMAVNQAERIKQVREHVGVAAPMHEAAQPDDLLSVAWELSTWAGSINWRGGENQKEWLDDLRTLIERFQEGYKAYQRGATVREISDELKQAIAHVNDRGIPRDISGQSRETQRQWGIVVKAALGK